MKHLWILNHYASEPGAAGSTRHFHLAEELLDHGWSTSILAASVEHLTGVQRLRPRERWRLETRGRVSFLWLRTPAYQGNGVGRLTNMLSYALRALHPATTRRLPRPAVVIGSSVHPLAAIAGALLARRHGVPFVFEVRDLWPQTLIDLGRIAEHGLSAWVLRRAEAWLYHRADRIITLLPHADEYIARYGVDRRRVVWISNGVAPSLWPGSVTQSPSEAAPPADGAKASEAAPPADGAKASEAAPPADGAKASEAAPPADGAKASGIQRTVPAPVDDALEPETATFELMYFGAHGQANALEPLIDALALVSRRNLPRPVRLRLIGDGPRKPLLQARAHALGLDERLIVFEGPVAKASIPAVAARAHAFVLSVLDRPQLYRYGISMNKLFDYMAASRPIILAANVVNDPVQAAGCGYTVPPENPPMLADAIERMVALSPAQRREMGRCGRHHAATHYSFAHLAGRLAAVLDACLGIA
jgi:glycosyltransferase involved in cell wall biosynthesis